ncbi:MAG: type VI secretion system tip protein VgrG [Syntrophobacteraceae bacterium]|jgi:type VI secretion system secreted protein VgrG|nr:type VI secretion system tip protein VgrG [Syntrophobacteraceae bacterium]
MALTQENRLMAIETPLGKDVLLLTGFRGREAVSSRFSFELSLISENHGIAFKSIIGKNVTVSLVLANGQERLFNGIVSRFSQGRGGGGETGSDPRFSHYAATMVPWLSLLQHTADVRIFQELNAPDIIEKVFREGGFNDFRIKLSGSYDKRDYCVQFRETHFNFVSRLMEEEGIYYYFQHERGRHTLILADSPSEHRNCPHQEYARYQISSGMDLEEDVIQGLVKSQEVKPAKVTLNDYNYSMPNTDLKSSVSSRQALGQGEREVYDFPGLYPNKGRGERLTTVRMEEEEARITTIEGTSNCRAFTSGYRFTLKDHYRNDWNNRAYVLTELEHEASEGANFPGGQGLGGASYTNRFACIPIDVPFRPERRTPKPVVHGTQTAVVVGPGGEEIHTDELGRIKVQFHWDRKGKKDENSSCWIRVGQVWAGPQWGAVFIPRIGQEVIVAFLEGNPDRPLVIGCVYHQSNQPPLDLPGEKTRSTVKSDSTIGGGGFNEIRFEDKKGQEEIYVHAQKDRTIEVENDQSHTIKHDRTATVMNNSTETVQGKKDTTVMQAVTINWLKGADVTIGPSGLTVTSAGSISITAASPVSVTAPSVTVSAGSITFTTAILSVAGVVQCTSLVASVGVVSPSYSPGVGNIV